MGYREEIRKFEEQVAKEEGRWRDIIDEIEDHPETVKISRQDYVSAWIFVENKYPALAERLAAIRVLKNENTAFCARIGIPRGAAGVFVRPASAIVVAYNPSYDEPEIIVVHELLHFCSRLLGSSFKSERAEEDFAYANSLPYLIGSGKTIEWIIEKYLLPYYWSCFIEKTVQNRHPASLKPLTEREKETSKEAARKHCMGMIRAMQGHDDSKAEEQYDSFDLV